MFKNIFICLIAKIKKSYFDLGLQNSLSAMEAMIFKHPESVLDKLQEQRELEEFCDVILEVEQAKFPAHRNVLASCSDYFQKMFTTDMLEKSNKNIKINDVTAEAMSTILTCIYTGKIELNLNNIYDVLRAASLMQLNSILDRISQHIYSDFLTPENCCFFRDLANTFSLYNLQNLVFQYFLQNFEEIHKQPSFLHLNCNVIERLLSTDELRVKEEKTVFEFVVKWVEVDITARQNYFPNLLKHVRLQFIPIQYIVNKIQSNLMVKKYHECRDIVDEMMKYHIQPDVSKAQNPRHSIVPQPDSVMLFPYEECFQYIYDCDSDNQQKVIFDGSASSMMLKNCAVATKHPLSAFCGGLDVNNQVTGKVVRFDGIRWINLPALNEPRCGAAAVFLHESLFVFGGENFPVSAEATYRRGQSNPDASNFESTIEKFDQEWSRENLEKPRSYFAAHAVNNKIYLIGGYALTEPDLNQNRQFCKKASNETLIFCPTKKSWKKIGNLHTARASFASAISKRSFACSTIYVFGGETTGGGTVSSAESLNTNENVWVNIVTPFGLTPKSSCCVNHNVYFLNNTTLFCYNINSEETNQVRYGLGKGIIVPFSQRYLTHPFTKITC